MDKQGKLNRRRTLYEKRRQETRQDRLIAAYIKVKYPVYYEEAREYYTTLNKRYSHVRDLRKTVHFKTFESSTKGTDTMKLEIPLTKPKEAKEKASVEKIDTIFPNIDMNTIVSELPPPIFPDIDMNTIVSELPPQFVDGIIQDLRADPNLASLMDDVEKQIDNADSDIDVDIEIPDDLLERELETYGY